MSWDPVALPWRVSIVFRGSQFPYGWRSVESVYASEAEARAVFDAPLPAYGAEVSITFAENAETWTKNGRWRRVDKRLRRKLSQAVRT